MKFSDCQVSTKTVMAYTNVTFNLRNVFDGLPVVEIPESEYKVRKKTGIPNIKTVKAPEGSIVSLRHGNEFRGIVTNPKAAENKTTKKYFLNQVTCIISIEGKNLHIMIFRGNFKIPGCRTEEQVKKAVDILWNYIASIDESFELKEGETRPRFFLETVMTNVDFTFGFTIDRQVLNTVMNSEKYEDKVRISRFEPTTDTQVNIRIRSSLPKDFAYEVMCFREGTKKWRYSIEHETENKYTKRRKPKKHTTFMVFSSSKTIVSGKHKESMEAAFDTFYQIIMENRDVIEDIFPEEKQPKKKVAAKKTSEKIKFVKQ
ncbi:hypothetical protein ISTM_174 [Insectomime virus]|uniref:Uncharacterized protein n=1 Tax=Tunisvirus fontaine2 TaxID=1421067 RepID=V9SD97_9VIRU|nr:hypothetical protein D1R32_gp146 [Tunisvirus fontaine2]AHA46072.1 hypothetical protein ISTM_174 [Insectomime virus]AHC54863.1 hypothetical protein TNS_ORF145 [Tunisvirus fontaine2]